MEIRPAKQLDHNELIKLYTLFVGDDRYSKGNGDSFIKVLRDHNSYIYVATHSEQLIGFATLSIRNVVRYSKPIAELDELFVLEKYRKHGIGKKLIETIEKKTKDLNCKGIFIQSGKDLKTAHLFYEKLGYTKRGYYFTKDL
jgi:GNAT superfamily N-acetyltransferase